MRFVPVVRRENVVQERHGPDPLTGPGRYAGAVTVTDTLGRPLRDLRISVTDRCNFRCVYCMPKEVFGRDYAFSTATELLTFEEIDAPGARLRRAGVREDPAHGRRAARPPRPRASDRAARGARRALDIALTTNGALLAREGAALADAGLTRHGEPRLARRRHLPGDERCRLPRRRRSSRGSTPRGAGLAGQDQRGRQARRSTTARSSTWRASSAAPVTSLRFIEYMDVGHTNGWRMDDVVPAAEIVAADRRRLAARARRLRSTAARSPSAGATSTAAARSASSRRSRSRSAATAHARGSRPTGKLYTCLFAGAVTTCVRCFAPARRTTSSATRSAAIWRRRIDRYSELRTAETASLPKVEMSFIGG